MANQQVKLPLEKHAEESIGGWTWTRLGFVNFVSMLSLSLLSALLWHHKALVIFSSITAAMCLLMILADYLSARYLGGHINGE